MRVTPFCTRPGENPDGDGDDNLAEFLGGFDPTDAKEFLQFSMTGKAGATANFLLNKAIPGRTYRLMESPDLATTFSEVGSFSVAAEEADKVVQDGMVASFPVGHQGGEAGFGEGAVDEPVPRLFEKDFLFRMS